MAGEAGRGPGRSTPTHAFMYILSCWRLGIFLPSNQTVLTYNPSTGFQVPLCLGMTIWVSWSLSTVAQWQSQLWMNGGNTYSFMNGIQFAWCAELHCQAVCVCVCNVERQARESQCLAIFHAFLVFGLYRGWTATPPFLILLTDHTGRDTPLGGWPSR